jgi:hypothetical protein
MKTYLYLLPLLALGVTGCAGSSGGMAGISPTNSAMSQNGPADRYYRATEPVIRDMKGNIIAVGTADVNRFMQVNKLTLSGQQVSWDTPR